MEKGNNSENEINPWGEYEKALAREYETIEHTRYESMVGGIVPKYCRNQMDLSYSMSFKVVDREKFKKERVLHDVYGIGEVSAFSDDISRVMKTVFRRFRRSEKILKNQAMGQVRKELGPILADKYGVEVTGLSYVSLRKSFKDAFVAEEMEED